tara:strand:- start:1436 stop:2188 length:753 start_codon:yes stop_codon:yes gene_type:complete
LAIEKLRKLQLKNLEQETTTRRIQKNINLEKRTFNDGHSWLEHYRYYPDQNSLQKDEKRVYDSQNVLTSSVRTLYKKESKKLMYLTLWLRGNSDFYENHLDYIRSGFVNSTVHVMNDVDQIVKSISIDNEGVFSNFKSFEYNSKGLKIKMTKFNTPDEKKEETSYEYDQNDNLIKETNFNCIKKEEDENIQCQYNDQNLKIKHRNEHYNLVINDIFVYSYDEENNWNERFQFCDGTVQVTVCKRKIEFRK